MASPERESPLPRAAFARFWPVHTRWRDNDAYGHVNNVVYYELFDTAVNAMLIEEGLLDLEASPIVGFVVETNCRYFTSLKYPQPVEVGVAVEHLGRSSVRYRLGIFAKDAAVASAQGRFTHVYVERGPNRPVAIPEEFRTFMEGLQVA